MQKNEVGGGMKVGKELIRGDSRLVFLMFPHLTNSIPNNIRDPGTLPGNISPDKILFIFRKSKIWSQVYRLA